MTRHLALLAATLLVGAAGCKCRPTPPPPPLTGIPAAPAPFPAGAPGVPAAPTPIVPGAGLGPQCPQPGMPQPGVLQPGLPPASPQPLTPGAPPPPVVPGTGQLPWQFPRQEVETAYRWQPGTALPAHHSVLLAPPVPIVEEKREQNSKPTPEPPVTDRAGQTARLYPPLPESSFDDSRAAKDPPPSERTDAEKPSAKDPPARTPEALPVGIPQFTNVEDNIATGLRPWLDEGLDWLQANSYRTVVHLRSTGEEDAADKKQVEKRGMKYLSLELSPQNLSRELVDAFNAIVGDKDAQPLFVYDRDGALAGAMWYLHFRTARELEDDAARVRARGLGLREDRDGVHREMWLAGQQMLTN